MTLTLHMPSELESRLRDEAAKQGLDAGEFILHTLEERLRRSRPEAQSLTARETELLEQINVGVPGETWRRYRELVSRREAESLGADEHAELLGLSDLIEQANAGRVGLLAELAKLRNVPLAALMRTLGIQGSGTGSAGE